MSVSHWCPGDSCYSTPVTWRAGRWFFLGLELTRLESMHMWLWCGVVCSSLMLFAHFKSLIHKKVLWTSKAFHGVWCFLVAGFLLLLLFCFSFLSGSNGGCGAGSAILKVNWGLHAQWTNLLPLSYFSGPALLVFSGLFVCLFLFKGNAVSWWNGVSKHLKLSCCNKIPAFLFLQLSILMVSERLEDSLNYS